MQVKDNAQMRETKAVALEIKADSEGRIEGYASRFGEVDQGGDIVAKGAFAESIAKRTPKMLWQHDSWCPIGMWEQASEDDTGLYVQGRILDTIEKGREARALIEAGAIDGMSIGYRTINADRDENGNRLLKQLELWEVSLVTFPMLESARVDAIKAAEMSRREMEALLTQDAGLSRSVARSLMDGGLGAVKAMQDAGGERELADALRSLIKHGA